MCAVYYLCNSKRQKICEACRVSCPGQSLTTERGDGSEGVKEDKTDEGECRDEKA